MKFFLRLIISTVSVFVAAYLVPGVAVDGVTTAFIVAIVLGVLNVFVKPLLVFLTLPITLLTLGLFTFVINLGLIYLAEYLVTGFSIGSILAAILFGLILSLVNSFLSMLAK